MDLAERLSHILSIDPSSWALEYKNEKYSWGQLAESARQINAAIGRAGIAPHDVVGWSALNEPFAVATQVALALSDHCAAILNPHLAPKVLAEEILLQRFPAIVGSREFWSIAGVAEAARECGTAGIEVEWDGRTATARNRADLLQKGHGPFREPRPDLQSERVSSGTTGLPKRIPESKVAILKTLEIASRDRASSIADVRLKSSPSIVFRSLAHAGSFSSMLALFSGRPIVLQEKFSVEETVAAIATYRPKAISLVPTAIKMIWDADVPVEQLSSLVAIRAGTAPLDPRLQEEFEEKYHIPILIDYGATEFGGVTTWTIDDHRAFAKSKRGSVGRAVPNAQIRVRDPDSGELALPGRSGILEVKIAERSSDWVATNDLASLDADGFLFIHGRADDAIVRGGFKILPEEVSNALRRHPAIQDVAVVGIADKRLGQVPVAVIELRPGFNAPGKEELKSFAREYLTPYQVPVDYKITDRLPRSASMKVIRPEVVKIAEG